MTHTYGAIEILSGQEVVSIIPIEFPIYQGEPSFAPIECLILLKEPFYGIIDCSIYQKERS